MAARWLPATCARCTSRCITSWRCGLERCALLQEVRAKVLPAMTQRHGLAAWIVDDTGFPKKGSLRLESRGSTVGSWVSRRTAG